MVNILVTNSHYDIGQKIRLDIWVYQLNSCTFYWEGIALLFYYTTMFSAPTVNASTQKLPDPSPKHIWISSKETQTRNNSNVNYHDTPKLTIRDKSNIQLP